MPVSRCRHCSAILLPEEAEGFACPACGGAFVSPSELEGLPTVEPLPAPRKPWGLIAAVAVLSLLSLLLWLRRPAGAVAVPAEETDAYRAIASAKQAAEGRNRAAIAEVRKLKEQLHEAHKNAGRVAELETQLAATRAEAARQREAKEKELAELQAKLEEASKALAEERAKGGKAVIPEDKLDDPAGTHVVEPINNGEVVRLSGRIGTLRVKAINVGVLDASALQARTITVEGAVNGKSTVKLNSPGGTVTLAGLNAEANVEIDAPGGSIRTGDLNGTSHLKARTREMVFTGAVQGRAVVALTITDRGSIAFKLIQGDSRVVWKKAKPSDADPRLDEGVVRGGASFARED